MRKVRILMCAKNHRFFTVMAGNSIIDCLAKAKLKYPGYLALINFTMLE